MIAWHDLPSFRDPDRLDAWLRRLFLRAFIESATPIVESFDVTP